MKPYFFYLLSFPIGLFIVSHIRLKRKFFWFEYSLFFVVPLFAGYWIYLSDGLVIVYVALAWILFGPFFEVCIGYAYLKMTGKHLWIYERMSILNKMCSWLVVPYWAIAGVGVWCLNELIRIWVK